MRNKVSMGREKASSFLRPMGKLGKSSACLVGSAEGKAPGLQTAPTLLSTNTDMVLIMGSWALKSLNSMGFCELSHPTQVANGREIHSFGIEYSKRRAAGP